MTTEQENKQKRSKCPEMAYCLSQRDCSIRVVALSDHILALGFHLCKYKSIFAGVLWQYF